MKKSGNNTSAAVIVTVLNEAKTIEQLLDALNQQTLQPEEVIIVDGGSQDGTFKLLRQYQNDHPNFPLKISKIPGNRSTGRNYAIHQASTELIAITDAGCIPEENWLEELVQKFQSSKTEVVAGYYRGISSSPFEEAVIPYALVMPDRVDPANFLPATRSMLLTKTIWQKLGGFDESLSDNEDYAFARRLKDEKINIEFAREAVVTWQPRNNLKDFYKMIYRFAKGDAHAKLFRPKVALIFLRYILAIILFLFAFIQPYLMMFMAMIFVSYLGWAISKNKAYTPNGWHWLPVLQITSDLAVIHGTVVGMVLPNKKTP